MLCNDRFIHRQICNIKPEDMATIRFKELLAKLAFVDNNFIICVIFVLCLSCFRLCSLLPCGKGLTYWLLFVMFNCVFVTFPCGILGLVWYLIVSIPDIRHLSYFKLRETMLTWRRHVERSSYAVRTTCNIQIVFVNGIIKYYSSSR